MPLLPPPVEPYAIARFFFRVAGNRVPVEPTGTASITHAREDENAFYLRDKLSSLTFSGGEAWRVVWGIENSNDRCQPIGLEVETRDETGAWAWEHTAVFTCAECKPIDPDKCSFTIQPTTDDAYRLLLESWDQEYNILNTPGTRTQVTAQLATIAGGTYAEFLRIDANEQADYLGVDGWATFLTNTSYISEGFSAGNGATRSRDVILFRYRLINVPMAAVAGGQYVPVDKTGAGWVLLPATQNNTAHTIGYAKAPAISGFKAYKIGTYNEWNDPQNPGRTNRYGDQLLLLPCFSHPADYGFVNSNYLKLTGTGGDLGGPSLGGAFNTEADGGQCLNVRRNTDQGDTEPSNSKSLWWKFGDFRFGRCFRLIDGVYELLRATIAGPPLPDGTFATPAPALAALLPPTPELLSDFFTNATNPATGETGAANELPRLQLSAGSDVKRYGATEAATRVLISLEQTLADLGAMYKVSAFVDPATGWLRIEHPAYAESLQAGGTIKDLTAVALAILPRAYSYRVAQLARYEELTIANGQTEDLANGRYFGKAALDYGPGGCTISREGQNKTTRATSRLTGDVAAGVLSGDSIPDSALFVLAPDTSGRLSDANALCAPSSLLARYYRRGMAASSATLTGGGIVVADSLKPQRLQENQSAPLGSLRALPQFCRLTTSLGANAELSKAVLNLKTGVVVADALHPVPDSLADPPTVSKQFNQSFPDSFR